MNWSCGYWLLRLGQGLFVLGALIALLAALAGMLPLWLGFPLIMTAVCAVGILDGYLLHYRWAIPRMFYIATWCVRRWPLFLGGIILGIALMAIKAIPSTVGVDVIFGLIAVMVFSVWYSGVTRRRAEEIRARLSNRGPLLGPPQR